MEDFEKSRVKKMSDFHMYNARNCTEHFDFDYFFENQDENQLLEFFITPKQVIVVYTGSAPYTYHVEIAMKLRNWINKLNEHKTKLISIEIDGTTGKGKLVTPVNRFNTKVITSDMYKVIKLIYEKISEYNIDDMYIEPLENLESQVDIKMHVEDVREILLGLPIQEFINKLENNQKRKM